jgi:hypothetical protein
MYSASAKAVLKSGLPARATTTSNPEGASSRAMSMALSGLSVSRIFGAIGFLLRVTVSENISPGPIGPGEG